MFEIMLIFFGILAILFLATVAPLVKSFWDTDPDGVLLRPYGGRLILVLLTIGITLLLTSCGRSNENDFAISRLADMLTLYWVLPANTEVAHFQLNDNVLEIETDRERFSDRRVGRKRFNIVCQKHETLQLTGMSRLDDIAIFHLRVHPGPKLYNELYPAPYFPTVPDYRHEYIWWTPCSDCTKPSATRKGVNDEIRPENK